MRKLFFKDKARENEFKDNVFANLISEVVIFVLGVMTASIGGIIAFIKTNYIVAIIVFTAVIILTPVIFLIRKRSRSKKCYNNIKKQFEAVIAGKSQEKAFYESLVFPIIKNDADTDVTNIEEIVDRNRFSKLIAAGGAGKTTILLYLVYSCIHHGWSEFNKNKRVPFYVPLNKIVNYEGKFFISYTVCKDYLGEKDTEEKDTEGQTFGILTQLIRGNSGKTFFFLLDGLNELRDEKRRDLIMHEMSGLAQIENIHIVLTSRSDTSDGIDRFKFAKYTVEGFTQTTVKKMLLEEKIPLPENDSMQNVLSNPMMLSVYKKTYSSENNIDKITNEGMLLKAYFSLEEENCPDQGQVPPKLIYRIILPVIGNFMERHNLFSVNGSQLRESIDEACSFANRVLNTNNMGVIENLLEVDNNKFYRIVNSIKEITPEEIENFIVNNIAIITKSDDSSRQNKGISYGFYHQIYRDFFSAYHIYNQVNIDIASSDLFVRVEPRVIATYFCQLIGENYVDSDPDSKDTGKYIYEVVRKLSVQSSASTGYYIALKNLLDFMIMVHGGLYGYQYSNLNFSHYALNGVLLSQYCDDSLQTCQITNSVIDYLRFSPQGHLQWVLTIDQVDENTMVSGGRDGIIKLWNIPLSYCVYSLKTNHSEITDIKYSDSMIYAVTKDGFLILISILTDMSLEVRSEIEICRDKLNYLVPWKEKIIVTSESGKIFLVDKNNSLEEWYDFQSIINDVRMGFRKDSLLVSVFGKGLFEVFLQRKESNCLNNQYTNIICFDNNTAKFDKEILIANEDSLEIISLAGGKPKKLIHNGIAPNKVTYFDKFQRAIAAYKDNTIVVWNIQQEDAETIYSHNDVIEDVFVIEEKGLIVSCSRDFSIIVYSLALGEIIDTFRGESYWIRKIISTGNHQVMIPSTDGSLKVIDYTDGTNVSYYYDDGKRAYSLCRLDDGKVVSSMIDGSVCLWNTDLHRLMSKVRESTVCMDDVEAIDSERFVSVNSCNVVFLWKAEPGKLVCLDKQKIGAYSEKDIPGAAVNSIYHFRNHNGVDLIVSLHWNNQVILWVCENDKLILKSKLYNRLEGDVVREDWPYCAVECAFDGEDTCIAVVSRKGYVHLYSVNNGQNVSGLYAKRQILKEYQRSIYSVIWLQGRLLASDASGNIIILDKDGRMDTKNIHQSRIFILMKIDESHFLSYSEDGYIKSFSFDENGITEQYSIPYVPGIFVKNSFFYANTEKNTQMQKLVDLYSR